MYWGGALIGGNLYLPFLAVVLNSFENLIKAIVHLPTWKKKITEAMTVDTNWLFAIFAPDQESGLRIAVACFDNGH